MRAGRSSRLSGGKAPRAHGAFRNNIFLFREFNEQILKDF